MGIEYMITISEWAAQADDHIALSLTRERTDFTDRDRQMLEMLRPRSLQAFLNDREREDSGILARHLGLSPREAEVLLWSRAARRAPNSSR